MRQGPRRTARRQNRNRHQGRARPLREIVNREHEPVRKEDHLGGKVRRLLPRPLADQRQPVAGEDADVFKPAFRHDPLAGANHVGCVLAVAHGAQRRIGLDCRVDVAGGRLVIDLPGPVGTLRFAQALREARAEVMVLEPHEPQGENPLRLHAGVGFEPADPISLRFLPRGEPVRRRLYRRAQLTVEIGTPGARFFFVEHSITL